MNLQNDLLLRTIGGESVERPPVWLMRQAGRILPQYRALRAKLSGFKELVETPDLAAEVTIQPVDELGVDAAILFSDILVIPDVMGLTYEMIPGKGPHFPETITRASQVEQLKSGAVAAADLGYVYDGITETLKGLNGRVPLIGFCGAPWTLLAYMVEGGGSKTFSKAKAFLYQEPKAAHLLMQKITDTLIAYLKQKAAQGVHVLQVFDSWAGMLSPEQYREFAIPYLKQICAAIDTVPVTLFAKGAWYALEDIAACGPQTIGLDWTTDPQFARAKVGEEIIFQGNLDPCQLYASPDRIQEKTIEMIQAFGGRQIVNLGHGVYPDTPLEGVKAFVNAVQSFRY